MSIGFSSKKTIGTGVRDAKVSNTFGYVKKNTDYLSSSLLLLFPEKQTFRLPLPPFYLDFYQRFFFFPPLTQNEIGCIPFGKSLPIRNGTANS
jgi:hypothetical protein